MKKTYIEPKITVVELNLEIMIAGSADQQQNFSDTPAVINAGNVDMDAREVIKSQDVWEEWWILVKDSWLMVKGAFPLLNRNNKQGYIFRLLI